MDYPASLEYLNSFIDHERQKNFDYPEGFNLDRMRLLAKLLGNPQNAFTSLIVAGSKGKGSTSCFLSSILRMDNYRVGLYTSPHLLDVRERIQVNGILISENRFAEIVSKIEKLLNTPEWRKDSPTFFEILTVIAFDYFKMCKIHLAVLEVGLGGLHDSTNIVDAKVAGITPISLEHTDILGKTIAKIAVQKAGIIKEKQIVVSAIQPEEATVVIQKTSDQKEAKLYRLGKEVQIFEREYDRDKQSFDIRSPLGNFFALNISSRGRHQIHNAAMAVMMAKALEAKTRAKISEAAIRQGLIDARWPGRMEVLGEHPLVVVDGAHNPQSVRVAMDALERHFQYRRILLVFGAMANKDVRGMLEVLNEQAYHIILTKIDHPRACAPMQVLVEGESLFENKAFVTQNAKQALDKAKELAGEGDVIFVLGSLYLVAEVKKIFEEVFS